MRIPGVIHQRDLARRGVDRNQVRTWQRRGAIRRVGQWYVTEQAPADLVAVLALGTRPTCVDACSLASLWIPRVEGAHVFRPRTLTARPGERARPVRRRRDAATGALLPAAAESVPPGPIVLHGPATRQWPDLDPVPELSLALDHAARCLPTVHAAILFESALDLRVLSRAQVDAVLAGLPRRFGIPLSRVRSDAQSGTETAVRWWLESIGASVRAQVPIPGVGRVDLLLGRSWVIECDSRTFHENSAQYEVDRRRDLALRTLGFTVTRLSWEQVFLTWPQTERMLLAILRRGDQWRALPARGLISL